MTKTPLMLFVLLVLVSCCMPKKRLRQETTGKKTLTPSPGRLPSQEKKTGALSGVPSAALSWDAEVYMVNFDQKQEAKVLHAVKIIKAIIASQEFRDRVLNYSYRGKKQFFDNDGLSNEQIYQRILDGAEEMGNRSRNNVMDVELELYHQATKTIGYTYPNTVRIWMNKKYFDKYTPVKVADNLMHEWMHKIGFDHAMTWSKDRDHSVPYAIGYLIEELAQKDIP